MMSLAQPNSPSDGNIYHTTYINHNGNEAKITPIEVKNEPSGVDSLSMNGKSTLFPYQSAYKCESLEPFAFDYLSENKVGQHMPLYRQDQDVDFCDVFSDSALIDRIVQSLDVELQPLVVHTPVMSTYRGPSLATQLPMMTGSMAPQVQHVHNLGHNPIVRKAGTFLNKDGRWIKGKPCRIDKCDKRAQSSGLCKGHGGGARCSFKGCPKSSQGGGLCRAHGGGKRCLTEGCDKGTQRNGFCYLHGGVRSCAVEGCNKKDRGNGKCFSHGGGRACQIPGCSGSTRRGMLCDKHLTRSQSL